MRILAAVVRLVAGDCRGLGLEVEHTPIAEAEPFGPNPAHVDIVGEKPKPLGMRLAKLATPVWVRGAHA